MRSASRYRMVARLRSKLALRHTSICAAALLTPMTDAIIAVSVNNAARKRTQ
jgi:hypothetical protein